MKGLIALLGIAGAAVLVYVVTRLDMSAVLALLATAGWGILWVVLWHAVPLLADTLSWWQLFPKDTRPHWIGLYWKRWVGESVNNLLPTAAVGGDIVRARLAILRGAEAPTAAATVVVDLTTGIFTQALFTLMGLGLLVWVTDSQGMAGPILLGTLIALVLFAGFYGVQRIGFFKLLQSVLGKAIGGETWKALAVNGQAFDHAIGRMYRRHRDVGLSCFWTWTAWILGAGEMWLGLRFLGFPISWTEALVLESLAQAVRGAMFLVPGAVGVQEAGFIGLGALLGIPQETSLALALLKRVRELTLGIPGLIRWQLLEGRLLWKRASVQNPPIP